MRSQTMANRGHKLVLTRDEAGAVIAAECPTNPDFAREWLVPGANQDALTEAFYKWSAEVPAKGKGKAKAKPAGGRVAGSAGTVGGLAPWFGAKRKLAHEIVRQLGPHACYVEPFCGSMAVLFAKEPSRIELVNDLNRDLVNVSAVLRDHYHARELLGRLHFTICAEGLYREARERVRNPYLGPLGNVERAYDAMVVWWMGRSGAAGTRPSRTNFAVRFSASGGSGASRWQSLVRSVPAFRARLAHCDVLNRDALAVLAGVHDVEGTAIYADPPYVEKTHLYAFDAPADTEGRDAWHRALAAELNRFQNARVVVSYYRHPLIDELYPADRWHRLEIVTQKNMSNSGRAKGKPRTQAPAKRAVELLLVNGPLVPEVAA